MNSIADFVQILRNELGLAVTEADAVLGFDQLAGWDSVHLLSLLSIVERQTGRALPLPDVLEAGNLAEIYALVAAA